MGQQRQVRPLELWRPRCVVLASCSVHPGPVQLGKLPSPIRHLPLPVRGLLPGRLISLLSEFWICRRPHAITEPPSASHGVFQVAGGTASSLEGCPPDRPPPVPPGLPDLALSRPRESVGESLCWAGSGDVSYSRSLCMPLWH